MLYFNVLGYSYKCHYVINYYIINFYLVDTDKIKLIVTVILEFTFYNLLNKVNMNKVLKRGNPR